MLGFEALAVLPLSALPMPAETVAPPVAGGWAIPANQNAWWRKRQDEEWVILHG
jgi:hypothetical protein